MRAAAEVFSIEQKREALSLVLESRTFDRSEQLKAFLRFICEMEFSGCGAELHEYRIGVEVLGRSPSYSPTEDAIVRNRAYALRRKLEEYYSKENPHAAVRIEIPRGTYNPHFLAIHDAPVVEPATEAAIAIPDPPQRTSPWWKSPAALFAGGFILAAVLCVALLPWRVGSRLPGAIAEAWGPLLHGSSPTLVHISTPFHLLVRTHETRVPGNRPQIENSFLLDHYRQVPSLPQADQLFVRPTPNSPLWGDAIAMVIAGRVLESAAVPWEVMPNRVTPEPLLRQRNAILLGRPEYSRIIARLMQKMPLHVEFNESLREFAILDTTTGKWRLPEYVANDEAEIVYGLITVLPSEGSPGGEHRTVILSGSNSAGAQAAAEYWTSARELGALRQRLRQEGHPGFPLSYQVVVKATAKSTMALDVYYTEHRVVSP